MSVRERIFYSLLLIIAILPMLYFGYSVIDLLSQMSLQITNMVF